jgi:hypothetical protein
VTKPKVPVPCTVRAQVIFVPLDDPDAERSGFGPDSVYFEYCILPLIGPTSCLLYRHVAPLILAAHHAEVALTDLARNLGLGTNIGPNSAVVKALARLQAFHIGAWRPDNQYALRRAVAPLTDRQAQRLPRLARTIHFQTVISGGSARSGSATPSSEAPDR